MLCVVFRGLGRRLREKSFFYFWCLTTLLPREAPRTSPMRPIMAVIMIRIKDRNLVFKAGFLFTSRG